MRLPVGVRSALLVPRAAMERGAGLDFVRIKGSDGQSVQRTVVPGQTILREGKPWREILTGLRAGDTVVWHDD